MLSVRAAVVSSHGPVTGVVGEGIVVMPDMGPERTESILTAAGGVAEVGGALAHIAVVSREIGLTLMVLPNACTILKPGVRITLHPGRCEIEIHDPD